MSVPSADPGLDYKGHTTTQVSADYMGMPGGAQILMKNTTSGTMLEGGTVLFSGGSGRTSVEIDASTPAGAYCLVALDAAGEELTQTVQFYISHDDAGTESL